MNFEDRNDVKKIIICQDGPYMVLGGIPLVRKTQVVSEYGEPLTWKKEETLVTEHNYDLCRCGHSSQKPFCDKTHCKNDFLGTETADPHPTAERQITLPGGKHIVVRRDYSLCSSAGFCAFRMANVDQMLLESEEPQVRSLIMAMIERCPSGSFTYALDEDSLDIEPDLPQEIAVTTEIIANEFISGPLWVTGYIPIERADGQPAETRNRVTLCCCGKSKNKPFCDGTHRMRE